MTYDIRAAEFDLGGWVGVAGRADIPGGHVSASRKVADWSCVEAAKEEIAQELRMLVDKSPLPYNLAQ